VRFDDLIERKRLGNDGAQLSGFDSAVNEILCGSTAPG
jgi:hypothetical protein